MSTLTKMDGVSRVLCPDDHPDRYAPDSGEAFASVARALRDEVLVSPEFTTVVVMVGAPGSGKSTEASRIVQHHERGVAVIDACHAKAGPRAALVGRIVEAGKQAKSVWMRTPLATCLDRQADRSPDRKVPGPVVTSIHQAIEATPPARYEGWTLMEERV